IVVNRDWAKNRRAPAAFGILQEILSLECKTRRTQQRGQRSNTLQECNTKTILPIPLFFSRSYSRGSSDASDGMRPRPVVCADLAATDHTYAILDQCTTKSCLLNVLDANSWLRKRLQTKCRLIKRMKLKLQDDHRELLTLR
uniref:Uncharacterized protein n=2 Tax=Cyprinus carpio TaxID=7962 RepID=A0A9J7ZIX0_CYPCA